MKILATLLILCVTGITPALSQSANKAVSGDHFLLRGKVYEVDMFQGTDKAAVSSQIVVYQEKELYVAFFTLNNGIYEFYLPVGHTYEIWYGGSAFVNKKVAIDSRMMSVSKKPAALDLDIGVFRPVDGQDFELLKEPYIQVTYDEEFGSLVPDMDYTDVRANELKKIFKKLKKGQGKEK